MIPNSPIEGIEQLIANAQEKIRIAGLAIADVQAQCDAERARSHDDRLSSGERLVAAKRGLALAQEGARLVDQQVLLYDDLRVQQGRAIELYQSPTLPIG